MINPGTLQKVLRLNKSHLNTIIFLSGFYFLYSEVLWQRILKLVLGSSTLSNSVVLTAIMSGLAAGYLLSLKLIGRISRDRLIKSVFILNILTAGTSVFVLQNIDYSVFISGFLDIEKTSGIIIIIFNYAFSLIITSLPCITAGMMIPVVQSHFPISSFSITYSLYNAGGLLGGFICAFYSIRYFGLYKGFYLISALLMAYALMVAFAKAFCDKGKEDIKSRGISAGPVNMPLKWIAILIFMLGFASLAMQVLYARVLTVIVSNTTYSFSTVVLVYIAGISAGSWLSKKVALKGRNTIAGIIFILVSWIFILILLLESLGGIYIFFARLFSDSCLRTVLSVFILSIILLFIPAVCLNMLFVYLTRMLGAKTSEGTASSKSLLYSTAGSVLGAITATFILLPHAGITKSLLLISLAFLIACIAFMRKRVLKFGSYGLCGALVLMFLFYNAKILPPSIFRMEHRDDRLLYYKETSHGNVCVIEDKKNGLLAAYVDNNAVIGTAYDAMKTVNMLGFLPLLYNPEPESILVIGFGMGVTSGVLGTAVKNLIFSVEIVPYIFKAAEFFSEHNYNILENSRLKKISMDGRVFLNYSKNRYDIISCDPTHPLLGSNSLYTKDYFMLCRDSLKEKGVMTQYLPMHFLSHRSFLSILKNFSDVFDDLTIWLSYTHLVIMGRKGDIDMDFRNIRSIDISVRRKMQAFGITDLSSLLSSYICDREALINKIPAGIKNNTDSFPFVEFDTFFDREEEFRKNIDFIADLRNVPLHLAGDASREKIIMAYKAKEYMIKALILEREGKTGEAVKMIEKGLDIYMGDAEMRNYLYFLKSNM